MKIIVNNEVDFMHVLGKALSEGDGNTIMKLQDISSQWLQTQAEADAQESLLTGALDAIGW